MKEVFTPPEDTSLLRPGADSLAFYSITPLDEDDWKGPYEVRYQFSEGEGQVAVVAMDYWTAVNVKCMFEMHQAISAAHLRGHPGPKGDG